MPQNVPWVILLQAYHFFIVRMAGITGLLKNTVNEIQHLYYKMHPILLQYDEF